MLKKILVSLFVVGLVLLVLQNGGVRAETQTIRLPLAPRYVYNATTNTFAEQPYYVSNACAGTRLHINNARYAVDIAGSLGPGTPIYAPVSGTVVHVGWNSTGYGLLLKIKEDGTEREHWLAHLSKFYVASGDHVDRGNLVALSGETGEGPAHLHYHVQTSAGDAVDVRGRLPGINWVDPVDFCNEGGSTDGTVHPAQIPNGVSADNCAEFFNLGFEGVWGFDAPNCQGNIIFGLLNAGDYNLASMGENDRLRSVSVGSEVLNFWLYGHTDNDSLKHCHAIDMWNLDTDGYNDSSTRIGWDPASHRINVGGGEMVSSGWNMVSRIVVTTDPCPEHQNSRVQAYEISYGLGVGGGTGDPSWSDWLIEFSKADMMFYVDIHTKVDAPAGEYDAHRVLIDGNVLYETSAAEYYMTWDTYGWADGYHTLKVQYRRISDGGNWNNALVHEEQFYLSPNRAGTAPCDGGDGVELTSGSDCIRLTQSFASLDQIGWSDRSDLVIKVNGEHEAWAYDGGNFTGSPYVILSGQTRSVGGNISSVDLRAISPTPVPPPESEFPIDEHTRYLFPFNEGSGSVVADVASGLMGTVGNGSTWVDGRFRSALYFPNDGQRGVTTSAFNVCPMTVEFWTQVYGNSGRLAGQLGGGGNNGQNKWLIYLENRKPKLEIWSGGGSQSMVSPYQLTLGEWHYIMVTYDCGTTAKMYVDNQFVGQLTTATTWNGGATTFEVGAGEGIYLCNCKVDDVRISDIVRDPSQQPTPTPVPTATRTATATVTKTLVPSKTPIPTEEPFDSGMITNGGFEDLGDGGWPVGWYSDGGVVVDMNSQGNQGTNSMHFVPPANGYTNEVFLRSQAFYVTPGMAYQWSQYVRTLSAEGAVNFRINEYDIDAVYMSSRTYEPIYGEFDGTWLLDYVPSSDEVAAISVEYYKGQGDMAHTFIDSVSMEEIGDVPEIPVVLSLYLWQVGDSLTVDIEGCIDGVADDTYSLLDTGDGWYDNTIQGNACFEISHEYQEYGTYAVTLTAQTLGGDVTVEETIELLDPQMDLIVPTPVPTAKAISTIAPTAPVHKQKPDSTPVGPPLAATELVR